MRSTFNILFYINRSKRKKNGKCPIMGRITVDGKQTQFSIKEEIAPALWSAKAGRSTGKEKSDIQLNGKLDEYEQNLTGHYNRQVEDNAFVTAESLKDALLTDDTVTAMLLAHFKAHNEEYFKCVGVNKSKGSYYTYTNSYTHLKNFIEYKYGVEDIALRELQDSFIEDFEFYLRFNKQFSTNTVFGILMKLKRIVHRAINRGIIRKNPFADFRCQPEETTQRWLSRAEIDRIMCCPMDDSKVEWVRLLFIFSTFTGISYADLYNLKNKNISTDAHGMIWIRLRRKKTGTQAIVPLIGIALEIYMKYSNRDKNNENGKVFDIPYYPIIHACLEEIRQATGLDVLSYHMSRHSFATTVCLSNGIPIETLSRMLGHKNISTTQIYAKITNRKVDEDMQALEKRLDGKFNYSQELYTQKQIAI